MTSTFETHRYVGRKDTAKLIRSRLKDTFPGVKFSVRCSRGSATDVRWTDGPTIWQVMTAVSEFESEGFDGMTDCRYATGAGELLANEDGTLERVSYHSGLILEHRDISPEWERKLRSEVGEFVGFDLTDDNGRVNASCFSFPYRLGASLAIDPAGSYATDLIYQLAQARDMSNPCSHPETYPCGDGWHRCQGCGMRTRNRRDEFSLARP